MAVREDRVLRPNGEEGTYTYTVKAPCVLIVPVRENRELRLIGQWRYIINRFSWEVPGGVIDEGEEPLQAAQRELREETGLSAKKWTQLGAPLYSTSGSTDELFFVFLAEGLSEDSENEQEDEGIGATAEVSFETALGMIERGEINDAQSAMAIMKAGQFLK